MRAALLALGACCLAQVAFAQAPRDSAGVTVRRYPRGARAPAQWSTEKKPLLSIGGAEGIGPTEFTGVQGAMRASNGLVAVADGGANELRVFDARGAFVRTIGRKGSGPGEFDRLITFVRSGDTMFVVDNSARLNVYTLDGTLLRVRPRPVISNVKLPLWLGPLSDGAMVYVGGGASTEPAPGTNIRYASIYRYRDGDAEATQLAHQPSQQTRRINGEIRVPWLGPGGRTIIKGSTICSSWSGSWQHTCRNAHGKVKWITSRDLPTETLTRAEKDTFAHGLGRANSAVRPKAWVDSFVRSMVFAEERPKLNRLELTQDGELWVGPFIPSEFAMLGRAGLGTPAEPSTWSVLGANGKWLADITLPARFRMLEAGRDYVLGVSRDEDDVESIVMLRLLR